ncbi:MAG TPA: ribokinase [Verrucomicrobiae bacterium]|nr:ribokinase [Verrucomicrobiae bacterium]
MRHNVLRAKNSPSIVVVGSSNTDMIIKMDRIPRQGETIIGGEFFTAAGGKGANQAVGAARAGGNVTFIARVGKDSLGEQAVAGFKRDGINVKYIVGDPGTPSGVALIFVGRNGENSIAVASGANEKLSPQDVLNAREAFAGAGALIMQLETPIETIQAAAELAADAGVRVILNPAPARPLPHELLRLVSILTPNETEAEMLTGIKITGVETASKAAKALLERGPKAVILTLGSQGAWVASPNMEQFSPAFKVDAVDTTAAGDIFNGALAVALVEGIALLEAVRFANAAAALSVTKQGAQPSAPTRAEIEAMLAGNLDKR